MFERSSDTLLLSTERERQRILHKIPGLISGFWKFLEWATIKSINLPVDHPTIPKHSLIEDLRTSIFLIPDGYLDNLRSGKIQAKLGEISKIEENGVVLKDDIF